MHMINVKPSGGESTQILYSKSNNTSPAFRIILILWLEIEKLPLVMKEIEFTVFL